MPKQEAAEQGDQAKVEQIGGLIAPEHASIGKGHLRQIAAVDNPLPEGASEEVYGGEVSENHTANFVAAMKSRKQPISDVWSHNRMLEICHLSNIAMRLNRALSWDPAKREIIGDDQANSFLARENRKGYEIDM